MEKFWVNLKEIQNLENSRKILAYFQKYFTVIFERFWNFFESLNFFLGSRSDKIIQKWVQSLPP